jgi:hypothetical protein
MPKFVPTVVLVRDEENRSTPMIVFARGRTKHHAVAARSADIALVTLDSMRYATPLLRNGAEYPPKRAASFWLNHDHRPVTKRARAVLRGLVARKPRAEGATS